MKNKKDIRRWAREERSKISAFDKADAERRILENIVRIVRENSSIRNIALFHPLDGELDLLGIANLLDESYQFLLPRVYDHDLKFHEWHPDDELEIDPKFGIHEPKTHKQDIYPELIICPLLCYDENNYRLGYGRGFYDRIIEKLKQKDHQFITIGASLSNLKTTKLPIDSHDHPMNYIITEKDIIKK